MAERSEYTMRETAAYFAARVERLADRAQAEGRLKVSDRVALDSVRGFLDRIARDDLGVYAPEPGGSR